MLVCVCYHIFANNTVKWGMEKVICKDTSFESYDAFSL